MAATLPELEPMYSEAHAAKLVNIETRSMRTEREAGRIRFKKVAGKIMYTHSQLVAWQREDEQCREREEDRDLSPFKSGVGNNLSGTSDGQKTVAHASVQRAKQTASALKRRSRTGSSSDATPAANAGPVVPIRS